METMHSCGERLSIVCEACGMWLKMESLEQRVMTKQKLLLFFKSGIC